VVLAERLSFIDSDKLSVASSLSVNFAGTLNDKQLDAVSALDGALLVLAGAGTGKTATLTARIARMIIEGRCRPYNVLAVTFTNKAVNEIKHRLSGILGDDIANELSWVGTFHSINVRILRQYAAFVGLTSSFTILGKDEQLRVIKQILKEEKVDEKKHQPKFMLFLIDKWKNYDQTPDRISEADSMSFADGLGGVLYEKYQQRLLELNACDFGDLILHVRNIMQNNPDIQMKYSEKFKYILVDEYQDTNVAQYMWLRILTQGNGNICCVGDDDQSIYGWRGADVKNILNFEQDFEDAKVVRLEQNYRSTSHILAAASGLIRHNKHRLSKTLWTDTSIGEKVRIAAFSSGNMESRWIGGQIIKLRDHGINGERIGLGECVVLVRASSQMRAFEEYFISVGLPYKIVGGARFYERLEIRDAIAYMRCVVSSSDSLAFERILNTPKRGLGDKSIAIMYQTSRDMEISLQEAVNYHCENVGASSLSKKARSSLMQLQSQINKWRAMLSDKDTTVSLLMKSILEESGYMRMYSQDQSPETQSRLDNLNELLQALEDFSTADEFLEHVSLVMEKQKEASVDAVTLMTLHAAKGLEFDAVFLPGWEEGMMPSLKGDEASNKIRVEEERRLAYVGMTRAKKLLTITYALNRWLFSHWHRVEPSRFIGEIPDENVTVLSYMYSNGDNIYDA